MGFFDKVKKALGPKKEDIESQNSDESIVNDKKDDGADFVQKVQRQEIELSSNRNILFVCANNTTISPMAEAIFNQFSGDRLAYSAGLIAQSGNRASEDAIKVCQKHGIELTYHVTTSINDFFLDDAGLILTSTIPIRDTLKMKFPDAEIFTIKEYAGGYSDLNISDSFNEGLASHVECFMEINEAVIKIIRKNMCAETEEIVERHATIGDERIPEVEVLSEGRLIVVSGLNGNLDYYNQYLSLWDKNDPNCHIIFLGNLIYSIEDDDGSLEMLDDAIEKSQNYFNFHYLLGINELSCIRGENIYKREINLKTKFEDLIVSKKGSLEPYLSEYVVFFKKLPYFAKTENGLFLSYSGPLETVKSLEDIGSDLNLLHDFLGARKGEYESEDVEEFLDDLGLKFMVVGNRPCEDGYDVFSRQLIISSSDSGENKSYLDIDLGEKMDSMDNLVGCLKSIGSIVKVDEDSVSVGNEVVEKSNTIKNFKYLDDLIHSGSKKIVLDSDIILSYEEESEYKEGIKLDVDNLVIEGNECTIDAKGKTRIFNCIGKNITIKKIKLTNAFTNDEGGAIYNNGELNIIDSFLSKNMAKAIASQVGGGGAIRNDGTLHIIQSVFFRNGAKYDGGAIYNDGELNIIDSNFNNNISEEYRGGAIANGKGKVNIIGSTFSANKASFSGGTIINWGVMNVTKSNVLNDTSRTAGAISNSGELSITDSKISKNSSRGIITNFSDGVLNIFKSNICDNYSNAISNKGKANIRRSHIFNNVLNNNYSVIISNIGVMSIKKSTLSNNNIKKSCNLIRNSGRGELSFTESKVINNVTEHDELIHNSEGNFKTFNCQFVNNTSPNNIILNNDSLQFYKTIFRDNNATSCIILNDGEESNLGIFGGEFSENNLDKSVICNSGKFCSIEKTVFEKNISNNSMNIINKSDLTLINPKISDEEKTILNEKYILIRNYSPDIERKIYGDGTVKIVGEFKENEFDFGYLDKKIHESNTKEINLDQNINFEDYELDYYEGGIELDIDNLIIDGGGHTINGFNKSRIFIITGNNITLKNITFKNGQSNKNYDNLLNSSGGAIKVNHNVKVTIENCEFIDNKSENMGGAIHNHGNLIITKSTFNKNFANEYGAAIYNEGKTIDNGVKLSITDSMFSENIGKIFHECSIYNSMFAVLNITNSTFADNKCGIIVNDKNSVSSIFNSTFSDNCGIIINDNTGEVSIDCSHVRNNEAFRGWNHSGTIRNIGKLTIDNSVISDNISNHIDVDGGAITNQGILAVTNSVLSGNKSWNGGAIYNNKELLIVDSDFSNNNAKNKGGAIFNDADEDIWFKVTIKNSNFSNNKAYDGGAIYKRSDNYGKFNLINCDFKDNIPRDFNQFPDDNLLLDLIMKRI